MAVTLHDSLVLGHAIELAGGDGGVPSVNPMCPGAVFRVQAGWDLNAPQPTTDFIASLIVDGERPFGLRASDRTITLPILIKAPDFRTLAGARELLMATIDAPHFPLMWTRATGSDPQSYPLVLDCFRAQPSVIHWGGADGYNRNPVGQITVKFQALPYGRSDVQQQIAFAAPVASLNSPGAPPPPVVLDAFSTINSPQFVQSQTFVVGPNAGLWDPGNAPASVPDGANTPLKYGATFPAPLNLAGMTSLGMWLGLGSRHYFNHHPRGKTRLTIAFTLTDTSHKTLSWSSATKLVPVSPDPGVPAFTRVSVRLPQNNAAFNYASVASYTITITNRTPTADLPGGEFRWTVAYIDALTAYPSSLVTAAPSPRGSVYRLNGVAGTHRAPVSLQFQQAPAPGTVTTITAAGSGSYTVPGGTVSVKAECWGGGGAGGTAGWGPYTAAGGAASGGFSPGPYITFTNAQTATMAVGDTFKFTAGPNTSATVYTITITEPNFAGFNNIHFTPASITTPSSSDTITMQTAAHSGGGGGEYAAEPSIPVAVGALIPYAVGAGGTPGAVPVNGGATTFGPAPGATLVATANGGGSATQNAGLGGSGSASTVHFPGGAGRTASGGLGGGGGGSAGPTLPGLTPTGISTVTFTSSGTWTCPAGVTSIQAECWGGGGGAGGGWTNNSQGGAGGGAGGEYAAEATLAVTPGNVYTYTVGTAGTAGSPSTGGGNGGGTGGTTTFPGSAVTVTANGGQGGAGGSNGNIASGGSGSSNTTHYNGGYGGRTGSPTPNGDGGGSSAGPSSAGTTGSNSTGTHGGTGAPAVTGGGAGGTGGDHGAVGASGSSPGGGGGGGEGYTGSIGTAGGAGGGGQIRLTYPGASPTATGAPAVAGGGAGGNGGATANTTGSVGGAPGGGGGGGNSAGTTEAGGAGAAGQLKITPFSSPAFKTLVVHRPGQLAPPMLNPFVPVGAGLVAPGATEYTVPTAEVPVPLNANSTFTTTVTPWTAQNSATLTRSTVWQAAGSALFTGNGTVANPGIISEATIPVTAGSSYTAQVLCYSPQGFATTQVIINWYTAAGTSLSSSPSASVNVPAAFAPGTLISVAATAPATAALAQIVVQMTGTPAATVQMFSDNDLLQATPLNAVFDGTYAVLLTNSSWNSPTAARTISVTVRQYESIGGPHYDSTTTPITITPSTQVTNGLVNAGMLTLPLKNIAKDNANGYFTVLVSDSNNSDRFYDCLFLDTQGQTVVINEPTTGYINYYIDEPDPTTDLGNHLGSQFGRPSAISVLDACSGPGGTISGGPITIEPGDNLLMAYAQEGAPAIAVSYFPRWFAERLE